ncbi:MAG: ferredoxin family protein [Promethearchaeota archaeon]
MDLDLCKASRECVIVCPTEVYEIIDGKENAENIDECIEYSGCQDTFPYNTILKHSAWRTQIFNFIFF